jgi:hypothetical protein
VIILVLCFIFKANPSLKAGIGFNHPVLKKHADPWVLL